MLSQQLKPEIFLLKKLYDSTNQGVVVEIKQRGIASDAELTSTFSNFRKIDIEYDDANLYLEDKVFSLLESGDSLKKAIQLLFQNIKRIDVLAMDCQKAPIGLLERIDFSAVEFRMILVNDIVQPELSRLHDLLLSNYYKYVREISTSCLYCRRIEDAEILRYKKIPGKVSDSWLTENVLCQKKDQPFANIVEYFNDRDPLSLGDVKPKLVHMINPYKNDSNTQAERVMQSTLKSIQTALDQSNIDVLITATMFQGEDVDLPEVIVKADNLTKSTLDLSVFKKQKKLPFVFDILDNALRFSSDEDYLVYTNMDICVNPSFYNFIGLLIARGFDAITINRRTVDSINEYFELPDLAAADLGYYHPGFDCFVIRKSVYKQFIRNKACVGVRGVDRSLLFNMVAFSNKFLMLKNIAMTFHLGNDMEWLAGDFDEYTEFVREENSALLDDLSSMSKERKQRMRQFCKLHGELLKV